MALFQIRRGGQVICSSSLPGCSYSPATLKDMQKNGMHLYQDGKKVKAAPGAGTPKGGKEK